jgi:AraC-like DNA-binding protein
MRTLGILDKRDRLGITAPTKIALPCRNPATPTDCMIIYIAQESKVIIKLTKGEVRLDSNDVCLFAPNLQHSIEGKGNITKLTIERAMLINTFAPLISFCPILLGFFLRCRDEQGSPAYLRFSHHEGETASSLIERISLEFSEKRKSYQSAVINALAELFIILNRDYYATEPAEKLPSEGRADLILGFLGEHYTTSSLESTARNFHCHPNTIATILKEEVGKNFSEIRRELRLERACTLLTQTALPITDIASLCGYENMTSFYKIFKEKYGTTPRIFGRRASSASTESTEEDRIDMVENYGKAIEGAAI